MSNLQNFDSVWDALEDDPVMAENMKLRSYPFNGNYQKY